MRKRFGNYAKRMCPPQNRRENSYRVCIMCLVDDDDDDNEHDDDEEEEEEGEEEGEEGEG